MAVEYHPAIKIHSYAFNLSTFRPLKSHSYFVSPLAIDAALSRRCVSLCARTASASSLRPSLSESQHHRQPRDAVITNTFIVDDAERGCRVF